MVDLQTSNLFSCLSCRNSKFQEWLSRYSKMVGHILHFQTSVLSQAWPLSSGRTAMVFIDNSPLGNHVISLLKLVVCLLFQASYVGVAARTARASKRLPRRLPPSPTAHCAQPPPLSPPSPVMREQQPLTHSKMAARSKPKRNIGSHYCWLSHCALD